LQSEFEKISVVRKDYEVRIKELQSQLDAQQHQFDEQLKDARQKVSNLEPQIGSLQSQVTKLGHEKQELTANLSNAEASKLQLTERDAEIQKLQIELRDTSGNEALQTSLQEHSNKVDNLTAAMRERDNEISRLNKIVTENRVGNKQHSSEVSLLKQEIDAQSKLISSLEEQAESTLQLHKKIANQSTDIEALRAELHSTRNQVEHEASSSLPDYIAEVAQLKKQISMNENNFQSINTEKQQLQSEINRLQSSLTQRDAELNKIRSGATASPATANAAVQTRAQSTEKPNSADKPRLFVRHGENPESVVSAQVETAKPGAATYRNDAASASTTAANLAGTQMPAQQSASRAGSTIQRRALYTRDGYRLKRTDGLDDLALLPGLNLDLADTLRKNDVKEFEQVALWTQREVAHFADRLDIGTTQADALQWPEAAQEILAGRFRVDASRVPEKN